MIGARGVRTWRAAVLAIALGCGASARDVPEPVAAQTGLMVVEAVSGYAAARAGLRPGDRLETWSRLAPSGQRERGGLATSGELLRVEIELGVAGVVSLHGRRGGRALEVEIPGGEWRLVARPSAEPAAGSAAADIPALWSRLDSARGLLRAERLDAAHELLAATLPSAPAAGAARAYLLELAAAVSYRRSDQSAAERDAQESLALWSELAPRSPGVARARLLLGKIARNRNRFETASEHLERALEVAEASDPGGALVAQVRLERANLDDRRGDLESAEAGLSEALARYEALGVADANSGSAAMLSGILAYRRGDFDLAEERMRRALELFRREAGEGGLAAWALNGLGLLESERGDPERAADLLRRSLAIRERLKPGSLDAGVCRENLGLVAASRGDLEAAVEELTRAAEIFEAALPGSAALARILSERGGVLRDAGDLGAAAVDLERALEIQARRVPGGLEHAEGLFAAAELERLRGRDRRARQLHLAAQAIRSRLAPGSGDEARSHHALGVLAREAGYRREALERFRSAAAAIDSQQERIGGGREDRSRFSARFAPIYRDLIELAVDSGEVEEAFVALERYRAQAMRSLVATRRLVLDRDLPAALAERWRELARAYEAERSELSRLGSESSSGEVERRLARLRELADERGDLERRAETASPRRAALRGEATPSLAALRAGLEPGTLVVAFSVHEARTLRFHWRESAAVPAVAPVALGAEELRRRVEAIRDLAASPSAPANARRALERRALDLGSALFAGLEAELASAARLLVIPDGALHALPFALLRLPGTAQRPGESRWLVERLPVSVATSLALRAALAAPVPRSAASASLVAFADPAPPAEAAPALGGARYEVEAIARLFPEARVFAGADATEERVKSELERAARLHFACHARLDDRFPLDSRLVLATPPHAGSAENGRLAAWEIFEGLRTGAALVTLSACESGLGAERAGEGLIGLTSAFQYAGARAVLSSLWLVSDRSSAELMSRFYASLAAGRPADEALRAAQLELASGPLRSAPPRVRAFERRWRHALAWLRGAGDEAAPLDATHPFHWAAFQLHGAPR